MWLYGDRIPKQLATVPVENQLNTQLPFTRSKSTMETAGRMRNLFKVNKTQQNGQGNQ